MLICSAVGTVSQSMVDGKAQLSPPTIWRIVLRRCTPTIPSTTSRVESDHP